MLYLSPQKFTNQASRVCKPSVLYLACTKDIYISNHTTAYSDTNNTKWKHVIQWQTRNFVIQYWRMKFSSNLIFSLYSSMTLNMNNNNDHINESGYDVMHLRTILWQCCKWYPHWTFVCINYVCICMFYNNLVKQEINLDE